MVHDGSSNNAVATPPVRALHVFKDAFMVGTVLNFEPKEINASACVFFGVISALAACLDLAVTPFLGEPCESGFGWPTAGMVVDECGVDTERVADPERLEVRFEGVTDENGSGAALGDAIMERCCVWTSKRVVVAMARDASVMGLGGLTSLSYTTIPDS